MNRGTLTESERIAALQGLHYTDREAAFLVTAALQGGYFLRRQYCEFIGKEAGGTAASLIQKLLASKHASFAIGCNGTKIYHLCSRPFYAAIGEEDNRNRRERPPFAIKNRLMGLDYVLAHPENTYLATEREKVAYFTATLGISQEILPAKRFTSRKSKTATDRQFVDKYPISIPQAGRENGSAAVSFCYIDEGVMTGSRFGNYLGQYRSLFAALGTFRIVYVAASDRLFRIAERDFRQYVDRLESKMNGGDAQTKHMLEHFKARNLYESRHFESFDREKLIQLREDRDEFSGPKYEALYQQWKADGRAPIESNEQELNTELRPISATFATHLLKEDYDVFGAAPRTSDGA